MKRFALSPVLALIALVLLPGCSSSPLAPTQSAIALEKSFTAAVKIAETRPLEERVKLAPYVHEGSKILDELADKTAGYSKPLTVSDFGDVAIRIAPDIAALLTGPKSVAPKPTTQPVAPVPSDIPTPPSPGAEQ
jgi:hypothetical protein